MTIRHLTIFVAVADQGSMSAGCCFSVFIAAHRKSGNP